MKGRVLVVDDDVDLAHTLCDILELGGYEARAVHDGERAVQEAVADPPSVVVMDIRMPILDGVGALRRIRSARPGLTVILMTAYAERHLLEEARREGAAEILTKPVRPRDLLPLLEAALDPRGRTVLLVDDDDEFLSTLAGVVERAGHPVLQAHDLREALERLDEARPGVAVLDLRLQPDLEPVDCVLAIRRASPGIVFVLHSGYPELMSDTRARIPGEWVQGCLRKPFPPGALLDLLDELTHA